MMKSVALTESVAVHEDPEQHDDDFILVPCSSAHSESAVGAAACWELSFDRSSDLQGDDEDASYDRCEDAYSIYSAPQSLAIDSNALESLRKESQGGWAESPIIPSDSQGDGGSKTSKMMDDADEFLLRKFSALGLSYSGLNVVGCEHHQRYDPEGEDDDDEDYDDDDDDMRDLIAACASGFVLPPAFDLVVEAEESSVSAGSPIDDGLEMEGDGKSSDDDIGLTNLLLFPKHQPFVPVTAGPKATTAAEEPLMEPVLADKGDDDPPLALSGDDDIIATRQKASPTRLCKKKRRKQLKLAKKAAAAAAAAAALTHIGSMVATSRDNSSGSRHGNATSAANNASSTSYKHPNTTSSKLSSKRQATKSRKQVANIAVACATASYASYREECLLRKTKK
jgi:hypothetical protein